MKMRFIVPMIFALSGAALAEDNGDEFERGADEYLAACAACHGANADGNGPIAEMFKGAVPDLTKLSAQNDGVFPTLALFHIVDGRTGLRGHGNPMPVFGNRYTVQAGDEYGPYGTEAAVRARVLELIYYLQSIQQ